jgi:diguanylate cyclase (GGDEF)-like protein
VSGSVLERLQHLPRPVVLLIGVVLIAAIAWLDAVTGPKLALNVFYLLPVMLVAWVTASTGYGLLRYAHQLSLAYLDIDGFKAVNDRHGHAAGDRVLIALAAAAGAMARAVDTVARLGGDEFVVLMPETDEDAALPLADRLREVCSQAAGAGLEPITCSVGVVTYAQPPRDAAELLASADALMYEAKAAGGDDVRQARVGAAGPAPPEARVLPLTLG